MNEEPPRLDRASILEHTTRRTSAYVSEIIYRFDVDTLHREEADTFKLNDIGRVELTTTTPLFFDAYRINRKTGSFILIDPDTNTTVAAGMIRGVAHDVPPVGKEDRKSTRLNSSHVAISYAVFCLKKKNRTPVTGATV